MDSMNYRKYIFNFPSTWLANYWQHFEQANHDTDSNSGTQVVAQNKDLTHMDELN